MGDKRHVYEDTIRSVVNEKIVALLASQEMKRRFFIRDEKKVP